MNFKVVYSDEIKRLPAIPESFASLREAIKAAFKDSLVTDFVVQYKDKAESEPNVIHSEGDFQQFIKKSQESNQSALKVFVQTTIYPVFINDEEKRAPVVEDTVKNVEVNVQDEQEKPAKKEKRERSRKNRKEGATAPVVSEAEAAIRADLLKKREEKQLKKGKIDELRGEVQQFKEMLTLLEMKRLEHKGKLISLKKTRVFDESITKEEAVKLRESKILLRDELKPIKQEIHDIKLKVHAIKNEVRGLQGKEPKARADKPCKGKGRERKCGKRIQLTENLEELASPVTPGAPEPAGRRERVKSLSEVFPHVTKRFIREMIHENPAITDEQIAAALIQA